MDEVRTDDRWVWHQRRNKVRYTRRGAFAEKKRRWKRDRVRVYPYPCDVCQWWHVTSREQHIDWSYVDDTEKVSGVVR